MSWLVAVPWFCFGPGKDSWHAGFQFFQMQHAGKDMAQVGAEVFHGARPASGIVGMNDFVLPELLQNLRNLLQASVQLEKPFVEDGFHGGCPAFACATTQKGAPSFAFLVLAKGGIRWSFLHITNSAKPAQSLRWTVIVIPPFAAKLKKERTSFTAKDGAPSR